MVLFINNYFKIIPPRKHISFKLLKVLLWVYCILNAIVIKVCLRHPAHTFLSVKICRTLGAERFCTNKKKQQQQNPAIYINLPCLRSNKLCETPKNPRLANLHASSSRIHWPERSQLVRWHSVVDGSGSLVACGFWLTFQHHPFPQQNPSSRPMDQKRTTLLPKSHGVPWIACWYS